MNEITVVATARAKPGMGDALLDAMKSNVRPTHDEAGCLHYSLHRSMADPDVVVVIERWASEEALAQHAQAPHMATFRAKAADLRAAPTDVQRYAMVPSDGQPAKMRF